MLSEVKLEVFLPHTRNIEGFIFPRVWKMILTEDSERLIFGDIDPYRMAPLPPLFEKKKKRFAIINEEQVIIYNNFIKRIHRDSSSETIDQKLIKKGRVEVCRGSYNVRLENL